MSLGRRVQEVAKKTVAEATFLMEIEQRKHHGI
jgi:hypothetical protein